MNNKAEKTTDKAEINAAEVAEWLSTRPDFFVAHRALLTKMDLPSDAGTAISLHQYQVRMLREEQKVLNRKLALLVKNVKSNHKINADLLGLAVKFIEHAATIKTPVPQSKQNLAGQNMTGQNLAKQNLPGQNLAGQNMTEQWLAIITAHFGLQNSHLIALADQPSIKELHRDLAQNRPVCENNIDKATLERLFASATKAILQTTTGIKSYAIVPLNKAGVLDSVLILGAKNADRFKPGMGTEFLQQLGALVQATICCLPDCCLPD